MNREAKRLGLRNTNFVNATGLPAPNHYSTARDMAVLAAARDPRLPGAVRRALLAQGIHLQRHHAGQPQPPALARPHGRRREDRVHRSGGLLPGRLREARRAPAHLGGDRARSPTRCALSESQKLLNFGFLAYDTQRLYKKGDVVASPEIYKGTSATVKLGFDRDVWLTLPRDRFAGDQGAARDPAALRRALSRGQKAGIMKLVRDHVAVAEIAVVALDDVPVAGFLSRGWDTIRLLFR